MKRILYAFLSLVLVVGCEMNLVDEVETTDQVLGGDQSGDIFLSPYWDWADAWPGPISVELARVDGVEATIKGGYSKFAFDEATYPLQSTGTYAGPAETVQIELPADAPSNMYCQIGMGHSLYDEQYTMRYEDVVTTFELVPGTVNRCMSYFGGFVYIYYDHDEGDIPASDYTITISNVVESNDFVYGETNERDWVATMMSSEDVSDILPWFELRSDRVILTLNIEDISATSSGPSAILEQWETLIDAQAAFAGYTGENEMPIRVTTDLQVPDENQLPTSPDAVYSYYGRYPATLVRSETSYYQQRLVDVNFLQASLSSDDPSWYDPIHMMAEMYAGATDGSWVEFDNDSQDFHTELKVSLGYATTDDYKALIYDQYMNMAIYYYTLKEYNTIPALAIDFTGAAEKVVTGQCPVDAYGAVYLMPGNDLMTRYNYATSAGGTTVLSHDERTTLFMQLLQQSDWGLIAYINKRSKELEFENDKTDIYDNYTIFAICAAEYLGVDLKPFFDFWGMPISAVAGDYMDQFTKLSQEYYVDGEPAYFFETAFDEAKNFEIQYTQTKTPITYSNVPTYKYVLHRYEMLDYFKDVWYYKSMAYYVEGSDAETFGDTTFVKDLDLGASAWEMFDGVGTTGIFVGGELAVSSSFRQHDSVQFLAFFDQELEINAIAHQMWNIYLDYLVAIRMTDIKYLTVNGTDSIWTPTVPDSFEILRYDNGVGDYVDLFYYYYFAETYKTAGIRFNYEPNCYSNSLMRPFMGEFHPAFYGSQESIDNFPEGTFIH